MCPFPRVLPPYAFHRLRPGSAVSLVSPSGLAPDLPAPTRPLGWSSADILRVAVLIALAYLTLWLLWVAQDIVFITFIGILFGLTLSGAVDKAARRRIPRGIAAPVMLLTVIGLLIALGFSTAPPAPSASRAARRPATPAAAGAHATLHFNSYRRTTDSTPASAVLLQRNVLTKGFTRTFMDDS